MNDISDEELRALGQLPLPAPDEVKRQRAIEAALLAYDGEQATGRSLAQGKSFGTRLRSIAAKLKESWTMDARFSFGLGTAALTLLLLPLGYQFYASTALSPLSGPPVITTNPPPAVQTAEPAGRNERVRQVSPGAPSLVEPSADAMPQAVADSRLATEDSEAPVAAPLAESVAQQGQPDLALRAKASAPAGAVGRSAAAERAPAPAALPHFAPGEPAGDVFTSFSESPVKLVAVEPVSTLAVDVDTASYAYVRRTLSDGMLPPADAVRIEELINYFSYGYPAPDLPTTPFKPSVSVYPTPWNDHTQILQIGIEGYTPPAAEDRASNLVFLIDTSGSMDEPDKLPLLKRAFSMLVDQLSDNDTVSIVVYAGSAGVVLEPTRAGNKAVILSALESLHAGGSTAGAAGIELAYRTAEQNKLSDGINRVILATDGDFNVGIDDPEALKDFIRQKRDSSVFLSVLGFGQGNLDDATMQALAQNGNGNASYIDSFREARKVLVAEGGGTLETIASDVKIQVEFNPARIAEYRLIGYETRALRREDFNNDRVDAGDVGAGHSVTALYEITPAGSVATLNDPLRYGEAAPMAAVGGELGYLKLRYKLPGEAESRLMEMPISSDLVVGELGQAPADARFAAAVAAFGQKLKGSSYGEMRWSEIRTLAQSGRGSDEDGYRAEFVQLIDMAEALRPDSELTSCAQAEAETSCR